MKITLKFKKDLVRSMIDMHTISEPFYDEVLEVFNAVLDLNYKSIKRAINPTYPSDKRFLLGFDGEKWDSFSWNECINPRDLLGAAMRAAVVDDIEDFRVSAQPQCCNQCGSTNDLTVDHKDLPFKKIRENFIEQNPIIDLDWGPPGSPRIFADINLEAKWIAYHSAHSNFQILCRSCNSSKGAK
jgi:5-methylcytosine-specific restriction endonuclease McrA